MQSQDTSLQDQIAISEATLAKLRETSVATLTTQLFRRGYRQQFLVGLTPLNREIKRFAGEAYTLRFIPSREDRDWDLGDLRKRGADNLQWEAVESITAGQVLMIDSRGDTRAASAGNMLMTRLMRRGAAAAVTDGAFRDGTEISRMDFPAYSAGNTATTRPAYHRAIGIQEPIGCAGVAVYPGDIVVGDSDGVVVIPRAIAEEVAVAGAAQEALEGFLHTKVAAGSSLWGTYPPNDQTLQEYEAWRTRAGAR
jgi:regulator of RNase E activity RraA